MKVWVSEDHQHRGWLLLMGSVSLIKSVINGSTCLCFAILQRASHQCDGKVPGPKPSPFYHRAWVLIYRVCADELNWIIGSKPYISWLSIVCFQTAVIILEERSTIITTDIFPCDTSRKKKSREHQWQKLNEGKWAKKTRECQEIKGEQSNGGNQRGIKPWEDRGRCPDLFPLQPHTKNSHCDGIHTHIHTYEWHPAWWKTDFELLCRQMWEQQRHSAA